MFVVGVRRVQCRVRRDHASDEIEEAGGGADKSGEGEEECEEVMQVVDVLDGGEPPPKRLPGGS